MPVTIIDPTLNLDEPTARKLVRGLLDDMTREQAAAKAFVISVMRNVSMLSSPRAQQRFVERATRAGGRTVLHSRIDTGKKGRFRYGFDYWKPRDTLVCDFANDANVDVVAPVYLCAEYTQRDTRTVPRFYDDDFDRIGYLPAEYSTFRHFAIPVHALARLVMRARCLSATDVINLLQVNWPLLCIVSMTAAIDPQRVPPIGQRGWLVPCTTGHGRIVYFVMNRDPATGNLLVPTVLDDTMVYTSAIEPLVDALNNRAAPEVVLDTLQRTPVGAKKLPPIRTQNAVLTNPTLTSHLTLQS